MTRKILLTITLLGCTAWMVAQSTPSSSDPSSSQSSSSSTAGQSTTGQSNTGQSSASENSGMGETTLQGCLSGSAGSYTLTDASGTQYQLAGDTSKLASHVNSEVEVKGSSSSSSASSSSSMPGSSASSGASSPSSSAGAKTFNVTKVKKVSSSCSTGK